MKEMIKRVREDRGGFTLAELLIVVAIIAVLVAVAIPVFANASDEATKSTALSDIRGVTASAATTALLNGDKITGTVYYEGVVDRSGHVTNVKKSTQTAATDPSVVEEWLKDKDKGETLTIVVGISDATATS